MEFYKKLVNSNSCYIIAEAGVNHNGSLDTALELIREAKRSGADCVKFQTFKAESVVTKKASKADYQLKVTDVQESQLDMLKKLELDEKFYPILQEECRKNSIDFLSTPYNIDDAIFLNSIGVEAFKIASGQLIEHHFLEKIARYKKPIILSTGMATLSEVAEAVEVIRRAGNDQIILLQCTTNYPSAIQDANVSSMVSMGKALGVAIGYSDHVELNYACYAAVALGARLVEKHFTLDRTMEGPDHSASLDPAGFSELVKGIKMIEVSLGSPVKNPTEAEIKNARGMRRSIVANQFIPSGSTLSETMLTFKRPATGIPPKRLTELLGKKVTRDIQEDELIDYNHIQW